MADAGNVPRHPPDISDQPPRQQDPLRSERPVQQPDVPPARGPFQVPAGARRPDRLPQRARPHRAHPVREPADDAVPGRCAVAAPPHRPGAPRQPVALRLRAAAPARLGHREEAVRAAHQVRRARAPGQPLLVRPQLHGLRVSPRDPDPARRLCRRGLRRRRHSRVQGLRRPAADGQYRLARYLIVKLNATFSVSLHCNCFCKGTIAKCHCL